MNHIAGAPKGAAQPGGAQTTQAERIKTLENAVNVMDCYSQNGFDSVEATLGLIKTALQFKETYSPAGICKIMDSIDSALYVCTDMRNCINGTAEDVGCNHSDERQGDGHRAAIQAMTEALKGGAA